MSYDELTAKLLREKEQQADRIEQLEKALREIAGMDEVALIEFKKGDGWLHQRVARAALEEAPCSSS